MGMKKQLLCNVLKQPLRNFLTCNGNHFCPEHLLANRLSNTQGLHLLPEHPVCVLSDTQDYQPSSVVHFWFLPPAGFELQLLDIHRLKPLQASQEYLVLPSFRVTCNVNFGFIIRNRFFSLWETERQLHASLENYSVGGMEDAVEMRTPEEESCCWGGGSSPNCPPCGG